MTATKETNKNSLKIPEKRQMLANGNSSRQLSFMSRAERTQQIKYFAHKVHKHTHTPTVSKYIFT